MVARDGCKWGVCLAVALSSVFGGWLPVRAGTVSNGTPPVFVATINGSIFSADSVRGVARAALERGLSLTDMINGIAFAKGALPEIIAGALDFGIAPETMVSALLANGYTAEQVSGVLDKTQISMAVVGPSSESGADETETLLLAPSTKGFDEKSDAHHKTVKEVRAEFDRIMVETVEHALTHGVRDLLKREFDICDVVKVAVERHVNLRDVAVGAQAAGYSREMTARCATAAGLGEAEALLGLEAAGILEADYPFGIENVSGFSAPVPLQGGIGGSERAPFIGAAAP